MSTHLARNLGLDLVRATEAAALRAGHWLGLGDYVAADRAATLTMCEVLSTIDMDGVIALGEETRLGQNWVLNSGARVGSGRGPQLDLVLDPLDGRGLLASEYPGAISAIAVAPRGALWAPPHAIYMDKLVVDASVAPALVAECMGAPAAWTLALTARAKGKRVADLTVFVLDRPRHADLIAEVRRAGARVMLRPDGDVVGALMAATPNSGVDLLMGIGGIPEGLIAACAVRALGGAMLGQLAPQREGERSAVREAGLDTHRVLTEKELVSTQSVFFAATGITEGPLLAGVQYEGIRAKSNSLILRGDTRTRRLIYAEHLLTTEDVEHALPLHSAPDLYSIYE